MTHLPSAFLSAMHRNGMPHAKSGILVAFSGGADSLALLHMIWTFTHKNNVESKHYTIPVLAFHVHHGIRGAEADRDAKFCHEFCKKCGIPFVSVCVDAPLLAQKEHLTLEEAARKVRYNAICAYLDEHPIYTHVLTAHHRDDQAETVLFRLLRGSSAKGLSGIAETRMLPLSSGRNVILFRPLLSLSKKELLLYCERNALPYVVDSTNKENNATRNRIRNTILPEISKINPAFSDALVRFSRLQAMDDAFLWAKANEAWTALPKKNGGLSLFSMRALDDAILTRVIALWFAHICGKETDTVYETPLTAEHLLSATACIKRGKIAQRSFPAGLFLSIDTSSDLVRLSSGAKEVLQETVTLHLGKSYTLENGAALLLLKKEEQNAKLLHHLQNIYKFVISTTINSDTIVGSLFLRPRKDNQTDTYLCGGSHKTAKDALSAHKVPLHMRKDLPLICDENGILWIPFCGIRDDVNPTAAENCDSVVIYFFYNDI